MPALSHGKRSLILLPEQLHKTKTRPAPECPPILALIGFEIIFGEQSCIRGNCNQKIPTRSEERIVMKNRW